MNDIITLNDKWLCECIDVHMCLTKIKRPYPRKCAYRKAWNHQNSWFVAWKTTENPELSSRLDQTKEVRVCQRDGAFKFEALPWRVFKNRRNHQVGDSYWQDSRSVKIKERWLFMALLLKSKLLISIVYISLSSQDALRTLRGKESWSTAVSDSHSWCGWFTSFIFRRPLDKIIMENSAVWSGGSAEKTRRGVEACVH